MPIAVFSLDLGPVPDAVWSENAKLDILDAVTMPSTAVFYNAKMHLYTNTPALSPDNVLGDFDLPTWADYDPVVVTWDSSARPAGAGGAENVGALCRYTVGEPGEENPTVKGAVLVKADDTVIGARPFDEQQPLVEADQLDVVPRLSIS